MNIFKKLFGKSKPKEEHKSECWYNNYHEENTNNSKDNNIISANLIRKMHQNNQDINFKEYYTQPFNIMDVIT